MFLDKAIIVNNLTKKYKLYQNSKERFFDLISPKNYGEDFYALRNVHFEANHGEVIGFVGINGSGKSTLSNIIAGIVPESSGAVKVNGQVALIAVAAGLKNDLTGRDNIELKLLMLGFSKEEIKALEQDIIEFSELGRFIDQPVKSYSSGMKSRLGFAISVNVDPDILIIDEALSVGDKAFAEKSLDKMKEFKRDGKTMIFVSHSIGQMKKFCDKILWLEYGMVKEHGDVDDVIPRYEAFLNMWKKMSKVKRDEYKTRVINQSLDYDKFVKEMEENEKKKSNEYKETLISRIGRIRAGESCIYKTPKDLEHYQSSKNFKGNSYYIKKQAVMNDEKFFQLSHQPSSQEGVIGWIKATAIATHNLVQIDKDSKIFELTGTGVAYDRPWGGKKNLIYAELKPLQGKTFYVERTDKVGKNIWYNGTLENKKVWIHQSHLIEVEV